MNRSRGGFAFRKSELLDLKVSDVNLPASKIQLRDSKNGLHGTTPVLKGRSLIVIS